ncbi:MAG: valine--tRNA ligase [Deltaproteobacteria bacterium]|nr:valine--tRNA ligase [Deltaproteobacteria bacterium]
MGSVILDKSYQPDEVEKRWYDFWEKEQLFAASENKTQKTYSIVIPPPNVTGVLHMGHALNITLQDILCRYRRLKGDNVLWMPGTDHAGIATQNVVEKMLASKNTHRHQLGREKFIEAVWQWKEKYGSAIINQLKRMGASCDWQRERFTMDEGLSLAVRKVFVQLYNEGLIYRGKYIINWCPRCHTALADLEVDHDEVNGNLYHIRYPYPNSTKGLIIATTRPETMLGDTAMAVNPNDNRYVGLKNNTVILPLMNKEIPIIKDEYVDMSFGTGALKITPAHDPNDFEIGLRHKLPSIVVIGDDGKMTSEAGKYQGLDRTECRKAVVKDLEEQGLLVKIEPHMHSIGHCYRCKTIIEPNLSEQWFVKAKPLAEKAIAAVKSGETKIIPDTWANTYFDWLENIRDWCISRQIWWGHQIPAWTCTTCNELIVSMDTPTSCTACDSTQLVQESDVLDTWFSSALWPFSTMGWPEKTPLLKCFYPTSVLVTGFDILFFWVARMMMMGLHFMDDVPFKDVYVHALVRDEDGKKMSKSKGNVIDPITIIDNYGTDAFRFTLAAFAAQGRDVKMSEKRVEGYRHFVNKLWNAARFALMHLGEEQKELILKDLSLPDKWILSRLYSIIDSVTDALEEYRFNDAASTIYNFVWHEFCDWYLEAIKPILYEKDKKGCRTSTMSVMWRVLHDILIMLHPFMPFVTEEIWHKFPGTEDSILKTAFPANEESKAKKLKNKDAEVEMEIIEKVITGIRNIRGEMNINPSLSLTAAIHTIDSQITEIVDRYENIILDLAKLESLTVTDPQERPKFAAAAVIDGASIFVSLEGIIDFEKEAGRLEKELEKLDNELSTITKKLNNDSFITKAPDDVVKKVKKKYLALIEKQDKLKTNLDKTRSFANN